MPEDNLREVFKSYIMIFSVAFIVYGLIYLFSGDFCFTALTPYNSYSRQAAAWLSGQLYLPENVPWLELANFEGRYYVVFPPFPSVILLPFVLIFGIDTPDNTIALIISLCSLGYAYKLGYKMLGNRYYAMFLSLFLILGTNYLHISLWGAVWYIAQNMAFLFTLMAFYYALSDNKNHSYIALFAMCAAMGCRTFNVLYLPIIFYLIYIRENESFSFFVKKVLLYGIPAFALGCFFLWLNYARFGSIFEFGYNYLPEFINDPHGMFYTGRMMFNLGRMLFGFNLLEFPMFYGFAFWVASPIVISFFICLFVLVYKSIIKKDILNGQKTDYKYMIAPIILLTTAHILLFSLYRTLGGHNFGSRYTVDTLPVFYLGFLFVLKRLNIGNNIYLNIAPMLFGLILNFYGTVQFLSYYYG